MDNQLTPEREKRARLALDAAQEGPAAVLMAAADAFRLHADDVAEARKRSWQSVSKELTQCAARLVGYAQDVAALLPEVAPESAPTDEPVGEQLAGLAREIWRDTSAALGHPQTLTDEQLAAEDGDPGVGSEELQRDVRDWLSGVAERLPAALGHPQALADEPVAGLPADNNSADDWAGDVNVRDFLAGATDYWRAPASDVELTREAISGDEPTTSTLNTEAQAMTDLTFPVTDDPFVDATGATIGRQAGAPAEWREKYALSFEQLMRPADPGSAPTHWSWSQLTTAEDCGTKYLGQRLLGLPQVPQWAQVGGDAFHKATELFDNAMTHDRATWLTPTAEQLAEAARELWRDTFARVIRETEAASGLAMGDEGQHWRASNRGKENYTWWLHEGGDMVARYVRLRVQTTITGAPREPLLIVGVPAIEWELDMLVPGPLGNLTVKLVIDRVWLCADGSLLIHDLKSGGWQDSADDGQLGLYHHALVQYLYRSGQLAPGTPAPRIRAQFYDARRGTYSEPIDAGARHPFAEYQMRFHNAEAQRRTGLYLPRRSSFCKGCSISYACPVGGDQA